MNAAVKGAVDHNLLTAIAFAHVHDAYALKVLQAQHVVCGCGHADIRMGEVD